MHIKIREIHYDTRGVRKIKHIRCILYINEWKRILFSRRNSYAGKRKRELDKKYDEEEYKKEVENRPEEFRCPKCDGINKSSGKKCAFCGYNFKRNDYFNGKDIQEYNHSNAVLYIISFLFPIIGIILGIVYIKKDEDELGKSLLIFSVVFLVIFSIIIFL